MSIPNITPLTAPINVDGKEYQLRKFRVVDFVELRKAVEKVLFVLAKYHKLSEAEKEYGLLTEAYAETIVVITCGSTVSAETILNLDHIAHRELFAKVMEYNADFFVLAATKMAAETETEQATRTDGDSLKTLSAVSHME